MVLFEDALKTVLSQEFIKAHEIVTLSDSLGRILAGDIFSDMDMPPFDKSAVDGYAFNISQDIQNLNPYQIVETIPAGVIPKTALQPGQCSKIMTGAMIPHGADCVIMVENTKLVGENMVAFTINTTAKNICYRGEDIKAGNLVLKKGTLITPAHIAVLASVGVINPKVAMLTKVGIISTGDELVEPSVTPGMAQIRNSNAYQLEAQVRSVPALPSYYGIARDEGPELRKMIDHAMESNDVVLLTGGVSMGDFDFVPEVMEQAGIRILFKSIAIQPGKPTVFGRHKNTFIFGLPGNPVSSFVLVETMVKPFLYRLMGHLHEPLEFMLPLGIDYSRRNSARKSMIPVTIKDGKVFPVIYHGSAHINAYTVARALMIMEIGTNTIKKGDQVYVRPI
jgi:molybdopterin molybdotransferase